MAEMHIPDSSLDLIRTIGEGLYEHDDSARTDARAIAAPVVAAELRRLRKILATKPSFMSLHVLAERADELDPRAVEIEREAR